MFMSEVKKISVKVLGGNKENPTSAFRDKWVIDQLRRTKGDDLEVFGERSYSDGKMWRIETKSFDGWIFLYFSPRILMDG